MKLSAEQLAKYERDGYLVIEDMVDEETRGQLDAEVNSLIEDVVITQDLDKIPTLPFQSQNDKSISSQVSKDELAYFLNSYNKIRLFMNSKYLPLSGTALLADKVVEVRRNANKLGHALHAFNPLFKSVTFDENFNDVVKSLGFKAPLVCQSMYIMKQVFSETDAPGHQDATYLHVEPNSLIGFWVAMEDSTPSNGCLQFIPGSHKLGIKQIFSRDAQAASIEQSVSMLGEKPVYAQSRFVSVPIKAGSAILINGLVVHKSTCVKAPSKRDVFAFHVFDSDLSTYSNTNWMKFTPEVFLPLY